jgi:hypothetical protein
MTINGHDLFDSSKRKYAVSFEDIVDVDIYTKFKFLEAHNFKKLLRERDHRLRNKIAHRDFLLDDSGNLVIDGERVVIVKKLVDLMEFAKKCHGDLS